MEMIKPIKLGSRKISPSEKLTAAEMGKLWAIYMGNSMSVCILSYYLQHVEDEDIKNLLENALKLSKEFMNSIKVIFEKESFPIPVGFTEEDVNLSAPRLFEDEYYVHYLKYVAKAGLSVYTVAIPLVFRADVREFFLQSLNSTVKLIEQIKNILMAKNFIIKPPVIPVPERVTFVKKDFLNGYIGHVRQLHALEIAHLYDNIENTATSKALITGFSQVVKKDEIRDLFIHGQEISNKAIERYMSQLHLAGLPSPTSFDHLITTSKYPPFSDKLMLYHKMDMFSMKMRAMGNSMAVNGRHDIGFMYTKTFMNIALFTEKAAKIMIENGWMEQPPEAVDRSRLLAE